MKDLTKAFFSYSLAVSFFGLKQLENMFRAASGDQRDSPATKSFEAVTAATTDQLGETLTSTFRAMDNLQRGLIGLAFNLMWPFGSGRSSRSASASDPSAHTSPSEPRRWTDVMAEEDTRSTHHAGSTPLGGRLQ